MSADRNVASIDLFISTKLGKSQLRVYSDDCIKVQLLAVTTLPNVVKVHYNLTTHKGVCLFVCVSVRL